MGEVEKRVITIWQAKLVLTDANKPNPLTAEDIKSAIQTMRLPAGLVMRVNHIRLQKPKIRKKEQSQ